MAACRCAWAALLTLHRSDTSGNWKSRKSVMYRAQGPRRQWIVVVILVFLFFSIFIIHYGLLLSVVTVGRILLTLRKACFIGFSCRTVHCLDTSYGSFKRKLLWVVKCVKRCRNFSSTPWSRPVNDMEFNDASEVALSSSCSYDTYV